MTRAGFWRLALLVAVLAAAVPGVAWAHAELLGSDPAEGEALTESPKQLVLHFNESVGPVAFKVVDRAGNGVGEPGEIVTDGNDVILPLSGRLPDGAYILTYRVVSTDTHPVAGSFVFSVGAAPGMEAVTEIVQEPAAWSYAVIANRWALYTFTLLAAGSALFVVLMATPSPVNAAAIRLGRLGAVLAGVSYLLSIGFGGAEIISGGADVIFASESWTMGASTTLGTSAFAGIAGLAILLFAFSRPAPSRPALVVGVALALGGFLVTGHAAMAAPVWVMMPAVAVHLVCAAFWLGALCPLFVAARNLPAPAAAAVMTKFSIQAVYAVTALFLSGVAITWGQVRLFDALLETDYGDRLIVKIALFLVLLGLAAYNKNVLTPLLQKDDPAGARGLRRAIAAEYVLYVFILGAAAFLTLSPPPRAIAASGAPGMEEQASGFKGTARGDGYSADVEVTPANTGANMVMVTVRDANGEPVKLAAISMTLALPAAGITGVEKKGEPAGPVMWHFMVGETIVAGEWEMNIGAFVTDFDKVDLAIKVPIK